MTIEEQIELMNKISTDKDLDNRQMVTCLILKKSADGKTCNCRVTGKTHPVIQAQILNGVSISEGETGLMAYPFADKNIPYVIGRSDISFSDEEEVSIRNIPEELGGLYINHYSESELQIFSVEDLSKSAGFNFTIPSEHELQMTTKDNSGSFYLKAYDSGSGDFSVKYNADFTTREEL